MNDFTPIEAVFVNTKRVASRRAVQVILEIPEEMHPALHERLGYPSTSESVWVACVRLNNQPTNGGPHD